MKFKSNPAVGGGGGSYLSLKDGESVKAILRGDPFEFSIKWENGKSSVVSDGTQGASFRFKINAIVREAPSAYIAKIWEQGVTTYLQLKALAVDYDLEKTVLKITRAGTGKESSYSVVPMPNGLDAETTNAVLNVKLHDLTKTKVTTPFDKEAVFSESPLFDEEPNLDKPPF